MYHIMREDTTPLMPKTALQARENLLGDPGKRLCSIPTSGCVDSTRRHVCAENDPQWSAIVGRCPYDLVKDNQSHPAIS